MHLNYHIHEEFKNNDDGIKMSFRSQGDIDVNLFAKQYFNGGGHKNAAGGVVYDKDMSDSISDGFYFTVCRPNMRGCELLFEMLRYGLAGIPLSTAGSTQEGIRICVSLIRENQIDELSVRLSALNKTL